MKIDLTGDVNEQVFVLMMETYSGLMSNDGEKFLLSFRFKEEGIEDRTYFKVLNIEPNDNNNMLSENKYKAVCDILADILRSKYETRAIEEYGEASIERGFQSISRLETVAIVVRNGYNRILENLELDLNVASLPFDATQEDIEAKFEEIKTYDLKEIFGDLLKITDEDWKRAFIKFESTHFPKDIF